MVFGRKKNTSVDAKYLFKEPNEGFQRLSAIALLVSLVACDVVACIAGAACITGCLCLRACITGCLCLRCLYSWRCLYNWLPVLACVYNWLPVLALPV